MSTKPDPRAELEAFIKANPELGDAEIHKAFEQRVSKDPALQRAIFDDLKARDPAFLQAPFAGLLAHTPTSRLN
jgi:hypothetical protein